jgi:hypothetical protein
MTAHKALALYRAARGWREDTSYSAFVAACKRAKDRNLVSELLDPFRLAVASGDDGNGIAPAVAGFKVRPWYSAAELARLWPLVCIGLAQKEQGRSPSAATVAKRLTECGLPKVKQWDGSTLFMHNGKPTEFFIVQDVWRLASKRFTQTDFDRVMSK